MSIKFTDNTARVTAALSDSIRAFLSEIGGEIQTASARNSRVDTGQTKGSYAYVVEMSDNSGKATIGSDLENAIWEEYGTGEYALNGNGRKGGWVYCKNGKYYHTYGKKPNRPLTRAFNSCSPKIQQRLAKILKSNLGA